MNLGQDHSLPSRFLRGWAQHPNRPALDLGSRSLSYAELHELALRWAGSILAGLPERPRAVAVLGAKGLESYVGILAAMFTGAPVIPLNPGFPPARIRHMLMVSDADVVIVDDAGLACLAGTDLDLPVLAPGHPEPAPGRLPVLAQRALSAPVPVSAGDIAYVLFTSGSTGRPKGVPISHASNDHYFRLMDDRYDFTGEDVFSQTVELNFDCAMFDLFCAWGAGALVQPVPPQAMRDLPRFAAERHLSVWFSVPSLISLSRRIGVLTPGSLPGLRWSFFAGEALRCSDAADWQVAAPGSTIENLYGPTELTITITGHRWHPDQSTRQAVNGIVPIGRIHPDHAYLLMDEADRPTTGDGELCIDGPQLTAGYLDAEDDRGRFLEHDGRRWYRTGDRIRRLDSGELAYLGRLDSQVQVHGLRVELAEVDHAVRSCTGVSEAVTVGRPDAEGGTELLTYYSGTAVPAAALVRQLRQSLAAGAIPRRFEHVTEFPLNPNGKIDRARLTKQAVENTTPPSTPPSTPAEPLVGTAGRG